MTEVCNKLKLPTTITATYKIITPMFIGDAEQQATTISPQSFKGALRFWWRALAWGRIRKASGSDEEALKTLHHQEAVLFGSSANNPKDEKNNTYGKGQVAIKIEQPKITVISNWPPSNAPNDSSAYLAYGLTGDNQNPHRQAISENESFNVALVVSDTTNQTQKKELNTALEALGLFGGLGSRVRRALGAIQLAELNSNSYKIADIKDYKNKATEILKNFTSDPAPYTALSGKSSFSISKTSSNKARDAHSALGNAYKNFRGQPSNLRGSDKKVFGLPLKGTDEKARRASPLFFHIVEYANGQFGYSVLYMPTSIFHKEEKHQKVKYSLTEEFVRTIGEQQ